MLEESRKLISQFNLQPHPEGGYYKEVYRSKYTTPVSFFPTTGCQPLSTVEKKGDSYISPKNDNHLRSISTAIYFLLEEGNFSAFHRICSDELWHHYLGDALEVIVIDEKTGQLSRLVLGYDVETGQRPLQVVPARAWFASRVLAGGINKYALVGCTVAPGFDYCDLQLARRDQLIKEFPQHEQIIVELTRQ